MPSSDKNLLQKIRNKFNRSMEALVVDEDGLDVFYWRELIQSCANNNNYSNSYSYGDYSSDSSQPPAQQYKHHPQRQQKISRLNAIDGRRTSEWTADPVNFSTEGSYKGYGSVGNDYEIIGSDSSLSSETEDSRQSSVQNQMLRPRSGGNSQVTSADNDSMPLRPASVRQPASTGAMQTQFVLNGQQNLQVINSGYDSRPLRPGSVRQSAGALARDLQGPFGVYGQQNLQFKNTGPDSRPLRPGSIQPPTGASTGYLQGQFGLYGQQNSQATNTGTDSMPLPYGSIRPAAVTMTVAQQTQYGLYGEQNSQVTNSGSDLMPLRPGWVQTPFATLTGAQQGKFPPYGQQNLQVANISSDLVPLQSGLVQTITATSTGPLHTKFAPFGQQNLQVTNTAPDSMPLRPGLIQPPATTSAVTLQGQFAVYDQQNSEASGTDLYSTVTAGVGVASYQQLLQPQAAKPALVSSTVPSSPKLPMTSSENAISSQSPAIPSSNTPPPPPPPTVKSSANAPSVPPPTVKTRVNAPPPPPPPRPVGDKQSSGPPPPPAPPAGKPAPSPPPMNRPPAPGAPPPPPPGGIRPKGALPGKLPSGKVEPPPPPGGGMNMKKLKPLHWDKVNHTNAQHSMVWDKLQGGSFKVDEEIMEALFGTAAPNKKNPKEINDKSGISTSSKTPASSVPALICLLDPRKSQNIAIVIRSLGLSRQDILDALLEGHGLGTEVLEKLASIALAKEEEALIRNFDGNPARLADAENFLFNLFHNVPSPFSRLNAMLFKSTYKSEVAHLKRSLQTLELSCRELKNSVIFVKLLAAVLKAGNVMNAGTARGNAQAFSLTTLSKLSDVKSSDGKTTLLHFIVREVVRTEGKKLIMGRDSGLRRTESKRTSDASEGTTDSGAKREENESEYINLGLQIVGGLSNEFTNLKKAAGIDYDALSATTVTLGARVAGIKQFLSSGGDDGFAKEMKSFVERAEEELKSLKEEQDRVSELIKSTTEYYQAGASKGKGASLQLYVIVRDFLVMVNKVCDEITKDQQQKKKPTVPATKSSHISASKSSSSAVPTNSQEGSERGRLPIPRFPNLPLQFMSGQSSSDSSSDED